MGFGVAGGPYKAPYDLNLNAVQLQELGDQPLKFFRRFLRLFLLRFTIFINVDILHPLE